MPTAIYYRSFLNRLAHLAGAPNPPHVQVVAAGILADELSPANPRRNEVQRLLREADPYDVAAHKLRDLHDHADPTETSGEAPPVPVPAQGPDSQEDAPEDEDADPL
ncbi:MAG: hypothetical protein F4Z51_09670 [Chloroflexi bacterium]|nr:hypothetical protein [Chloroflexota bacterium]MYD16020.1 hypothetical protein [Chloroflexota bacterium]MYJ02507.1 hypothetical protein [Chloroflexota bacterium]